MKNIILLLLVSAVTYSCSDSSEIECDLVGNWVYEREVFNSFSTFEDPDTKGLMTFNDDETGLWESDGQLDFDLEWDLQSMETKIAVTKNNSFFPANFTTTRIYDLVQNNDDQFTLTFSLIFEPINDTIPGSEQFENIILTRLK